jgi:hypothetical protein
LPARGVLAASLANRLAGDAPRPAATGYRDLNPACRAPHGSLPSLPPTLGGIEKDLFETDTSGYTQYGRAYLSLQSDVSDDRFIAGSAQAARAAGVEYTPVVNGQPSLFQGGAAFPGNDWTVSREGQDYLSRIPQQSHRALARIRAFHLQVTEDVLRKLAHGNDKRAIDEVSSFQCR